ncbi:MAG: hypothetical protein ABIQ40_16930 [Bacteroidia bacterium]
MNPLTCDFWWSAISGMVGNSIFTLILIFVIQKIRYWSKLRCKFHNVQFKTYWKRFPADAVHIVTCKVKSNRILFSGHRLDSNDIFNGEVIINPINLKMGEGFHSHTKSDGFAFIRIIIEDDDTFLVESSYVGAKKEHELIKGFDVPQAFIWKRVR